MNTNLRVCTAEELRRYVRVASFNARSDNARSLEALHALKFLNVTADLLMKTGIGKEVKKLSKQRDNPSVSAAAAAVVEAWQALLLA